MHDEKQIEFERNQRELRRAEERARSQHNRLKEIGKESRTSYGTALFDQYGEQVTYALDLFLGRMMEDPVAGPHHRVWPLLLHFHATGPRGIAVIGLTCVIDRISRVEEKAVMGRMIGRALQDELNAMAVKDAKGHTLLGLVKRHYGRQTVSQAVMKGLAVPATEWTELECRELGMLVLDQIEKSTGLIETAGRSGELIRATEDVKELIRTKPPRPFPARKLPKLTPSGGWPTIERNGQPMVRCRGPLNRDHLTEASLDGTKTVLTILENQEIHVDPWMVEVQKEAWRHQMKLFGVMSAEDAAQPWHRKELRRRVRVQEALNQADEVAGRPIWLDHYADWRGRIYADARFVGHQGPEHQKALISFGRKEVCNEKGFESMLMAAATHWGMGAAKWDERLDFGKENLDVMAAVADSPLDRIDLWKDAKDPWQFLQACKAIREWLLDPSKPVGLPIRYDQTCSGLGIIGMLMRDEELCRLTNCIGTTRKDVYAEIAKELERSVERDLHDVDMQLVLHAEKWLGIGINRNLVKPPIVASIYGSRLHGTCAYLTDWLHEHTPAAEDVADWEKEYSWPAIYLARKLHVVMACKLKSCLQLERWFRETAKRVIRTQQYVQWQSPAGFPLSFGREQDARQKTDTVINGSKRWRHANSGVIAGELSGRKTNQGIFANSIHAFDAAMCSQAITFMAGKSAPVLTNHDCFATIPSYARTLHQGLHENLSLYRVDWLEEIRQDISRSSGIAIADPPERGGLCEGKLGENPYCFS